MSPVVVVVVGMMVVIGGILWLRLHPFLALILGALAVGALTTEELMCLYGLSQGLDPGAAAELAAELSSRTTGARVAAAFGSTAAHIGILIAMAAIIGKCLLDSGAAEQVVRSALRVAGERGAPAAFAGSGFLLGIPVFFDTVFYLMIPLGKALAARTGRNYALYVMTIAAGATIAHSLVPPTPGPLAVAEVIGEEVNARLPAAERIDMVAVMIVAGALLGAVAVIPGLVYASWANRRWPIPLRASADLSLEELETLSRKDDAALPPLWLSLLPILLPVGLIVGWAALGRIWDDPAELGSAQRVLRALAENLGDKNVALTLSAAVAMGIFIVYAKTDAGRLSAAVQSALSGAGVIILITAAGGAFGGVLKQTGIGWTIQSALSTGAASLVVLAAAFLTTSLIRTAQGSATVAMMTSAGVFAGLAGTLPFHPVYLALAIGFGSKPFAWMNDSGFWVVCKMSGQTEGETLRNHSVVLALMGVSGLVLTIAVAAAFPMRPGP
jgi:GntP family gluconate:H+ symporter